MLITNVMPQARLLLVRWTIVIVPGLCWLFSHIEILLSSVGQGGLIPSVFGFSEDITVSVGIEKNKRQDTVNST
jgi:hypothetical protein